MADFKHCDDYIDDPTQPECLRKFLDHGRAPAHGAFRDAPKPELYATYEGRRVRVTMASRFGDVGVTTELSQEYGYQNRVAVASLSGFSANRHAPDCCWQAEQVEHECTCAAALKARTLPHDR